HPGRGGPAPRRGPGRAGRLVRAHPHRAGLDRLPGPAHDGDRRLEVQSRPISAGGAGGGHPMSSGPGGAAAGRHAVAEQGARWFRTCFGHRPQGVWLAPGRVNIIGEHTDYNDGFVLPFALGQGIVAAASPRRDDVLALRTHRDPAANVEIPLARLRPAPDGTPAALDEIRAGLPGWARYPAGVAWSLLAAGHPVPGASLAIDS